MQQRTRNIIVALAIALGCLPAMSQTCLLKDEIPEGSRRAIESSAQQALDQAIRGDVAALRTGAIASLQSNFGGIAAAVSDHKAILASDHAQLRTLFLLSTGDKPDPSGQFYCGVFAATGQTATSAEFSLPGLPAGKYGIVIYDLVGDEGPHAMSMIFQDVAGWKLAGFYIRPQSAAGRDGLWYLQRARDYKAKGEVHNAWFYYVNSWNLMAPVTFMSTKLLSAITQESSTVRPKDIPDEGGAVPFAASGKTYKITDISVVRGPKTSDLSITYSLASTADAEASRSDARSLGSAYLAQYPEIREAFDTLVVHAVNSTGGEAVGLLELKPPQNVRSQILAAVIPRDVEPLDPAIPLWMRPVTTPVRRSNVESTASSIHAAKPAGPDVQISKRDDGFKFRVQSDEVNLPATVVDGKQHLVTTLAQADFVVYEDDQPQKITLFRREDVPVSIGILVDNSGSMREKRAAVSKAVVNFVKASHPQDEVFIVNFNDWPYLDQDFTSDVNLLRHALDQLDSRGSTALFDAVLAAAEHLSSKARLSKRILLVVTDGQDNFSRASLEDAIRAVQKDKDHSPIIYTIGILGSGEKERQARRALETLSSQTGGVAFFPQSLNEVDDVSQEVARDIRNQYSITYKPTNPQGRGGYRTVKVLARTTGQHDLSVRTRAGYFARGQEAATATK
jgi:Ca-activated chloride channel homolog